RLRADLSRRRARTVALGRALRVALDGEPAPRAPEPDARVRPFLDLPHATGLGSARALGARAARLHGFRRLPPPPLGPPPAPRRRRRHEGRVSRRALERRPAPPARSLA